jgi:hypothetical protein
LLQIRRYRPGTAKEKGEPLGLPLFILAKGTAAPRHPKKTSAVLPALPRLLRAALMLLIGLLAALLLARLLAALVLLVGLLAAALLLARVLIL